MMKKYAISLLVMTALLMQTIAFASPEWTGNVVEGRTYAICAAYGGTVEEVYASEGTVLEEGDALIRLTGENVYSPCDGTVTAVFAAVGDDAGSAAEKYDGAIIIAPTEKYLAYMTVEQQYSADDSHRVQLGETVYLRCKEDDTHVGMGRIIEADGTQYTVEVVAGQFSNGEVVYAGVKEGFLKSERMGIGTVLAAEPVKVSAAGIVVRSGVSVGDHVEAGQFLMETAAGDVGEKEWNNGLLTADAAGIVLSINAGAGDAVEAGQVLAVVADAADWLIEIRMQEDEVNQLPVQTEVSVQMQDGWEIKAKVIFSSYMADADGYYEVLARPIGEYQGVRLGQTVCVRMAQI